MPETRDWKKMNEMVARLLEERTGEGLEAWNKRVREKGFADEKILEALPTLGEVVIQTRKTYVSLVGPRRTFARIQPTTRTRIDLGLRLMDQKPEGRLLPSKLDEFLPVRIALTAPEQVDGEVLAWLQKAYDANL